MKNMFITKFILNNFYLHIEIHIEIHIVSIDYYK